MRLSLSIQLKVFRVILRRMPIFKFNRSHNLNVSFSLRSTCLNFNISIICFASRTHTESKNVNKISQKSHITQKFSFHLRFHFFLLFWPHENDEICDNYHMFLLLQTQFRMCRDIFMWEASNFEIIVINMIWIFLRGVRERGIL